MKNSDKQNEKLCDGCTKCCEHVAIELDEPEDREDLQHIIWFLMHENVRVFIDEEDDWYLEFDAKCTGLDGKGGCKIYDDRPDICREYNQDECEKYGDGEYYEEMFHTREDFLKWLDKNPKWKKLMDVLPEE